MIYFRSAIRYLLHLHRVLLLAILFIPVAYGQQNTEDVAIPADENSLATQEDEVLDQELQLFKSDETPVAPTPDQGKNTASEGDASPSDTLSQGLESLFSGDEAPNQTGTSPSLTDTGGITGSFTTHAVLQGLNKITARTSRLEIDLNKPVTFGTLEVTVHKCWKSAPEEMHENKVLMEVWEQKPGEEKSQIFSGWMVSSSASVSALENPVYDITVLACEDNVKAATDADTNTKPIPHKG